MGGLGAVQFVFNLWIPVWKTKSYVYKDAGQDNSIKQKSPGSSTRTNTFKQPSLFRVEVF